MGRPSKLNPTATKAILKAVAKGLPRKTAAQLAGITDRTLYLWSQAGRKAKSGPYFRFFQALKKADAKAIEFHVGIIHKAAGERDEVIVKRITFPDGTVKEETITKRVFEWTAAAWWLERRHWKLFGRKDASKSEPPTAPTGSPGEQGATIYLPAKVPVESPDDPTATEATAAGPEVG